MKTLQNILRILILAAYLTACGSYQPYIERESSKNEQFITELPGVKSTPTISLTPTSVPTPNLPDTWKEFTGDGVSIWMLKSWIGMDIDDEIRSLSDEDIEDYQDFSQVFDIIRQYPDLYKLFLFDLRDTTIGFKNNVSIISETLRLDITLEEYIDYAKTQFPSGFDISNPTEFLSDQFRFIKWHIFTEADGIDIQMTQYVTLIDQLVYTITFSTTESSISDLEDIFDQSVMTFKPIPKEEKKLDWKTIQSANYSIELPDYFIGGDLKTQVTQMKEELGKINPSYEETIDQFLQLGDVYELFAVDYETGSSFIVLKDPSYNGQSPMTYLNTSILPRPDHQSVDEYSKMKIGTFDAFRVIMSTNTEGVQPSKALVYFIFINENAIMVMFNSSNLFFENNLPIFEAAMETFTIK